MFNECSTTPEFRCFQCNLVAQHAIANSQRNAGGAVSALARIYFFMTGCSLPEFDIWDEVAEKIIQQHADVCNGYPPDAKIPRT